MDRLKNLVRGNSGSSSDWASPGAAGRHDSIARKITSDKLFCLLDAISDVHQAGSAEHNSHKDESSRPPTSEPKPKRGAHHKWRNMDKSAALEEMLKMALTDPEPDTRAASPLHSSPGSSPFPPGSAVGNQRPRRHSALGSPLQSPQQPRRTDRMYVPRDRMAERVTTQLLSLTSKEVVPIQLLAIQILWALSTDTPAAKEIADKGGLRYLLRLLKEGSSPTNDHRILALNALQSFATSDPAQLIQKGGVEILMNVSRFGDRHVQIKVALCLRNLLLKDAVDVIPFGTLLEVRPVLSSASSKMSPGLDEDPKTKATKKDTWPGFLAILQSSGIIFELESINGDKNHDKPMSWRHIEEDSEEEMSFPPIKRDGNGSWKDGQTGESWHRLRPQSGGRGSEALWRVEGAPVDDSDLASEFVPSILVVAYRFGFEQGSEKLLLRLVKDAVLAGWQVTVFAMALKEVNALVGIPLVRMTTDPTVFENGAFDLLCIHMSDMRLLNPHVRDDEMPLRFFICPTNSTAGISGLRKPSRMVLGGAMQNDIVHLGVQRRSKHGIVTMHEGPPPLVHPAGVYLNLIPMPSADNLLDGLRCKLRGLVKLTIIVERACNFPLGASEMLILTVTLGGKEIFRSKMIPSEVCATQGWCSWSEEQISCTTPLEQDSEMVVFTILGLYQRASTAATAIERTRSVSTVTVRPSTSASSEGQDLLWREVSLASTSCTVNGLRTLRVGRSADLTLPHSGEFFGKKRCGTLTIRSWCRLVFEDKEPDDGMDSGVPVVARGAGLISRTGKGSFTDILQKQLARSRDADLQKRLKDRPNVISDGQQYVEELKALSESVSREHQERKAKKKQIQLGTMKTSPDHWQLCQ